MACTKETLYAAPTLEPISPAELKAWLRIDHDDEDAELADKLKSARVYLEEITWRAFVSQTWDYCWDYFESELVIPRPPLKSITSITYLDTGGVSRTLSTDVYEMGTRNGVGYVRPKYAQSWPATLGHMDVVTVRAVCGYGDTAGAVPHPLRTAIKYLSSHFHSQRDPLNIGNIVNDLPFTVESLIAPYRVRGYGAC